MTVTDSVTIASVQVSEASGEPIAYDRAGGDYLKKVRSSCKVAVSQGSTSFKSKLKLAASGVFELSLTAVIVIT